MVKHNWMSVSAKVFGLAVLCAACHREDSAANSDAATPKALDQALIARANAGDSQAQVQVGIWALDKAMRPAEYREAAEWFRKAAESGNAEAQCRLGTLYQAGRGVAQDYTNALLWLQKAAAQNFPTALYDLGDMYGTGRGVPVDRKTAAQYFRQAAELGHTYAQFNMARRCAEGQGVATNFIEAWKWYDLAQSGGIASAADGKRSVEQRLTSSELEQARSAADALRKQLGPSAASGAKSLAR